MVAVLVVVVVQAAFTLGLILWGRWVAKRHPTAAWRYASRMPLVALGLAAAQYAMTAYLIMRGFGRVAGVAPEEKARFSAETSALGRAPPALARNLGGRRTDLLATEGEPGSYLPVVVRGYGHMGG